MFICCTKSIHLHRQYIFTCSLGENTCSWLWRGKCRHCCYFSEVVHLCAFRKVWRFPNYRPGSLRAFIMLYYYICKLLLSVPFQTSHRSCNRQIIHSGKKWFLFQNIAFDLSVLCTLLCRKGCVTGWATGKSASVIDRGRYFYFRHPIHAGSRTHWTSDAVSSDSSSPSCWDMVLTTHLRQCRKLMKAGTVVLQVWCSITASQFHSLQYVWGPRGGAVGLRPCATSLKVSGSVPDGVSLSLT